MDGIVHLNRREISKERFVQCEQTLTSHSREALHTADAYIKAAAECKPDFKVNNTLGSMTHSQTLRSGS